AGELGTFYTEEEFDLSTLLTSFKGRIAEAGRSCVDSEYRNGTVMKLLWSGIALYLLKYDIDLMFGCASFHGTDPEKHTLALSYLHHVHGPEGMLLADPTPEHKAHFMLIPKEEIDQELAFSQLPPLIKGYLRLGAKIGHGAFIDHHLKTIDVCVMLNKH